MEVKKSKIKAMPYEDFKDNESLEQLVEELNAAGTNVVVGVFDDMESISAPSKNIRKDKVERNMDFVVFRKLLMNSAINKDP